MNKSKKCKKLEKPWLAQEIDAAKKTFEQLPPWIQNTSRYENTDQQDAAEVSKDTREEDSNGSQ